MKLFLFVLFFSLSAPAAESLPNPPPSARVLNYVLFSEGNQSWTARDHALYKRVLFALTKKEKITEFSETSVEDFLASRLLKREAVLFEIVPQPLAPPTLAKSSDSESYSKQDINQETQVIAEAFALIELKKNQLGQKVRFKAWMDVLKRKYAVKIKANE